jgi:hypothetical protein
MFSYEHLQKLEDLAKRNGDLSAKLGKVMVNGNYKKYTFMTTNPEKYSKIYGDARIVLSGDIRKIRYTEPE